MTSLATVISKPSSRGTPWIAAAEAVDDMPELAVVHVHRALPGDLLGVYAERVALLDVVIQHRGEQVVRGAYGVEVAGEVQVYVLHGHDLGVAAAGRAALDAEDGAERGLAQRGHGALAYFPQAVGEADRGSRLALAGGRRGNGRHEYELPVRRVRAVAQELIVHLGLVVPVLLDVFLGDPSALRYGGYALLLAGLGYLDVGFVLH